MVLMSVVCRQVCPLVFGVRLTLPSSAFCQSVLEAAALCLGFAAALDCCDWHSHFPCSEQLQRSRYLGKRFVMAIEQALL